MPTITNLEVYLKDNNYTITRSSKGVVQFDMVVNSASGDRCWFKLEAYEKEHNYLSIKEIHGVLPVFCPNRHINSDKSFCLGLQSDLEKLSIKDWITRLKEFLTCQIFAKKIGKWPITCKQWSHGNGATYQKNVEELLNQINLEKLGLEFNKLRLIEKKNIIYKDLPYFHVYHEDRLIITRPQNFKHNKRLSCICTKHGRSKHVTLGACMKKCSDILINILINEKKRVREEEKFWESFKTAKLTCCQTMNKCGLK